MAASGASAAEANNSARSPVGIRPTMAPTGMPCGPSMRCASGMPTVPPCRSRIGAPRLLLWSGRARSAATSSPQPASASGQAPARSSTVPSAAISATAARAGKRPSLPRSNAAVSGLAAAARRPSPLASPTGPTRSAMSASWASTALSERSPAAASTVPMRPNSLSVAAIACCRKPLAAMPVAIRIAVISTIPKAISKVTGRMPDTCSIRPATEVSGTWNVEAMLGCSTISRA